MINVPLYLSVDTDDPEKAIDLAEKVVGAWGSNAKICIAGKSAPDPTLLKAESGQVTPRTYVTVPGLSLDIA